MSSSRVDGEDRQSHLEALGTAPLERQPACTTGCTRSLASRTIRWPGPVRSRGVAWRLHVPAAVTDLTARAQSSKLSPADRRVALDTLAFDKDPAASKAMLAFAKPESALREPATVWLLNRMSNDWSTSAGTAL